ncbi:MAG: mercuric transporter MerT family protein [Alphaproteobacteria bacterium]
MEQADAATLDTAPGNRDTKTKGLVATVGILGALSASACCVLPLTLFSLGISGAWIGNLTAMYPYKWYFVGFTLVVLAAGYYLVYRTPKVACADGTVCARPVSNRIMKSSLWLATVLVGVAIAFPYAAPYLLDL